MKSNVALFRRTSSPTDSVPGLHCDVENGRTNGVGSRSPRVRPRCASLAKCGRMGCRSGFATAPPPGQAGLAWKVSASDAQVSNRALLFPGVEAFEFT